MSEGFSGSGMRWVVVIPLISIVSFFLGRGFRPDTASLAENRESVANVRQRSAERNDPEDARVVRRSRPALASAKSGDAVEGMPFEPGKSREWLLLQIKRGGWEDDPSTFFRMQQSYATMDEAAISEITGTLLRIIRERPTASAAELETFSKEWLFKNGIFPALFRFSQLNPNAALDLIERDSVLRESDAYQVAFANLASMDPDQALARTRGLEGGALRNAMEPILGTLFSEDPDRVIEILENYPQPEFDGERRKVAERLAGEDPGKAIDYALKAVAAGRNPDVIDAAVNRWRVHDPVAANRWLNSYDGPRGTQLNGR